MAQGRRRVVARAHLGSPMCPRGTKRTFNACWPLEYTQSSRAIPRDTGLGRLSGREGHIASKAESSQDDGQGDKERNCAIFLRTRTWTRVASTGGGRARNLKRGGLACGHSRRARLYEGGKQFISCVAVFGADFLACGKRVSEGCEGRRDREDGAQCSVRDAEHGGQGFKVQGGARAGIFFRRLLLLLGQ